MDGSDEQYTDEHLDHKIRFFSDHRRQTGQYVRIEVFLFLAGFREIVFGQYQGYLYIVFERFHALRRLYEKQIEQFG